MGVLGCDKMERGTMISVSRDKASVLEIKQGPVTSATQGGQRILSESLELSTWNQVHSDMSHTSNIYRVKEIYLDRMHFCGTE